MFTQHVIIFSKSKKRNIKYKKLKKVTKSNKKQQKVIEVTKHWKKLQNIIKSYQKSQCTFITCMYYVGNIVLLKGQTSKIFILYIMLYLF
jgi:hypothetical protein